MSRQQPNPFPSVPPRAGWGARLAAVVIAFVLGFAVSESLPDHGPRTPPGSPQGQAVAILNDPTASHESIDAAAAMLQEHLSRGIRRLDRELPEAPRTRAEYRLYSFADRLLEAVDARVDVQPRRVRPGEPIQIRVSRACRNTDVDVFCVLDGERVERLTVSTDGAGEGAVDFVVPDRWSGFNVYFGGAAATVDVGE